MCGIGGIIAIDKSKQFSSSVQKKMIQLMEALESRGTDAFGIFLKHVDEKNHLNCWKYDKSIDGELFKIDGSVSDFFNKKGGKIDTSNLIISLIHTRAANTSESTEIKNNHPFNTKDFILAHNGTITNHIYLKSTYKFDYDTETDSAIIVALIQKYFDEGNSIQESIIKTSEKLDGNYACWLYHKGTDDVYLFKKGNPISVSILKKRNIMVFASEARMISETFGVGLDDIDVLDDDSIFILKDGTIEKLGELKSSIDSLSEVQSRRVYPYSTVSSLQVDKLLTDIFELAHKFIDTNDNLKVSRVYEDIIIVTTSAKLKDLTIKERLGVMVKYLKGGNSNNYYRISLPLSSASEFIEILAKKVLDTNQFSEYENDFEASLTLVGEELGFDWDKTNEGYILRLTMGANDNLNKRFKDVGLHFSKKGVLVITRNSFAYKGVKKLIENFISDNRLRA